MSPDDEYKHGPVNCYDGCTVCRDPIQKPGGSVSERSLEEQIEALAREWLDRRACTLDHMGNSEECPQCFASVLRRAVALGMRQAAENWEFGIHNGDHPAQKIWKALLLQDCLHGPGPCGACDPPMIAKTVARELRAEAERIRGGKE